MDIDRSHAVERRVYILGTSVRRTLRPAEINEHDWLWIVQQDLQDQAWTKVRSERKRIAAAEAREGRLMGLAINVCLALGAIIGAVAAANAMFHDRVVNGGLEWNLIFAGALGGLICGGIVGVILACCIHVAIGGPTPPRDYTKQDRTNDLLTLLVLRSFWH